MTDEANTGRKFMEYQYAGVLDDRRGYANEKPNIIPQGQYDKGLSCEVASGNRKLIFGRKIGRSS